MLSFLLAPLFVQTKAFENQSKALTNAKMIGIATEMYLADHKDRYPAVRDTEHFKQAVAPYLQSSKVWISLNPKGGGLCFALNLAGVNEAVPEIPGDIPLLYDSKPWPDGKRIVTFADGHTDFVKSQDWPAIERRLKTKYSRRALKEPSAKEIQEFRKQHSGVKSLPPSLP